MTDKEKQDLKKGLAIGVGILHPGIGLAMLGGWLTFRAAKVLGKGISAVTYATARHVKDVAVAKQHRLQAEAYHAERERQRKAEQYWLEAQTPPQTPVQKLAEHQSLLQQAMAGIEKLTIPEDEKIALRNQALDTFMTQTSDLMR